MFHAAFGSNEMSPAKTGFWGGCDIKVTLAHIAGNARKVLLLCGFIFIARIWERIAANAEDACCIFADKLGGAKGFVRKSPPMPQISFFY